MTPLREAYEFLKKCRPFYIATMDGDQPRVRPFGAVMLFEDKIYIHTGREKPVSKQMAAHPQIEICGLYEGKTMRIEATAVEDDRIEPQRQMIVEHPNMKTLYAAGDGNHEVLYLKNATARFLSREEGRREIHF